MEGNQLQKEPVKKKKKKNEYSTVLARISVGQQCGHAAS